MEGMSNDWITGYFKDVTLVGENPEWKTQLGLIAVVGAMGVAAYCALSVLKHVHSKRVLLASTGVAFGGPDSRERAELWRGSCGRRVDWRRPGRRVSQSCSDIIGDRYPQQSGTAFSTIFVIALVGNMAINKTFGYIAEIHGIEQYAKMMLGLLACSAVLLYTVCSLFASRPHR